MLALALLALAACETKRAPAPPSAAEKPVAAVPAPKGPEADGSSVAGTTPGDSSAANQLVLVQERNQVCMVNDQYMGRDQIPVTIAEKTYYGCCPMCKGRLELDATARMAKDPVTGNSVDKATAAIGRAASGQVYYFESEETLRQYKL